MYPARMTYNDKVATDGPSICNMFAELFASVYVNSGPDNTNQRQIEDISHSSICSVKITIDEVTRKLKRLDKNKGAGPDNIPPLLFYKCADALSLPTCTIFNKSLQTGTFPDMWKFARIVPIYKKGNRGNVANYRPISILSVLSKVFESLIHPIISRYISPALSDTQHGFTVKRSTITNLANFLNYVTDSIDSKKQVDTIYTDFSKAFDKVNHKLLTTKLSSFGVGGSLLSWFSSYLVDRCSYVAVKGNTSQIYRATSGVPQGSILGPLLFNVFINDITKCIQNSKCFIFADDLKLSKVIIQDEDVLSLQSDIDRVSDWCKLNGMDLNPTKCTFISFTRKHSVIKGNYTINSTPIQKCNLVHDLGITLDSKLRFNVHIDNICRSARKALGFLYRNAKSFKRLNTKILLYNTLVRSKLEYGTILWNPTYQLHKDRLEIIQRRFTKSCYTGTNKNLCYTTRLKTFKLNSLSDRRKLHDLVFLHKLMNGAIDNSELLSQVSFKVPLRIPRHPTPLFTHKTYKTNLGHCSLIPRLSRLYKELVLNDGSVDLFKDNLSTFRVKILKSLNATCKP